jgi:uncharacterized protein (TIGR03437 family)
VTLDAAGNLYVLTYYDNRVRKVTPAGTINTIAGNGSTGFSGDGGPAVSASLASPNGIAVDAAGNLYIADSRNNRIRRVTPDGTIGTVAGNGSPGFAGDGGPATGAALNDPFAISLDAAGNLYIADTGNSRIRKVTHTGAITTIAGNGSQGFSGDGGPAPSAALMYPSAAVIDATGNLFIADTGNNRIRRVATNGTIGTVAGNGSYSFSGDGGSALNAALAYPSGVAVDTAGILYVADTRNSRIRKVTPNGAISTVAGNGSYRFSGDGGPALSATLNTPGGVTVDSAGNVYLTDTLNNRVRKVTPGGIITTIAGNGSRGYSGDGGLATSAALYTPNGIAVDRAGNLYIVDTGNNRVRKVTSNGAMSTVAGGGPGGVLGDGGPAINAMLDDPFGVAVDAAGNLYIADTGNNRIRKVTPAGAISTIAGTGSQGFSGDGGPAASAALSLPDGVAVDAAGNLYIADTGNNRIRKVTPNGTINTLNGSGPAVTLNSPSGVALDAAGNLFIADAGNYRIRMLTANGVISTVAGTGASGFSGDGGPAAAAALSEPSAVAVDAAGNVYLADTYNHAIREVLPSSAVSFKISSTTLTFSATSAGLPPQNQSLGLSSSIAGVAFSTSASDPWLSVAPASGAMPTTLQVAVDPSTLAAGSYQGTLTIMASNATPSVARVAVTFNVQPSAPPKLNLSSQSLSLTALQGSSAQTGQVQVQNMGGGALDFTAASNTVSGGNWLSVSPASGTATPTSQVALTVSATPGSLAPGTYSGTVAVTGAGSTAIVAVTLSVPAPSARILLSQSGLSFIAVAQGGTPLPQGFGILNVGQGSMGWSATATTLSGGNNWLQLNPSSGTVVQPYLDVSQVNVSIDPTGLAAGDYYGKIQISSAAANSPQLLMVILTVLPVGLTPGPEVRPAGLIFTGVAGSTPGSQDVMLGNPKPQPYSFSSGQIGTGFTYLPTNANVAPDQPTVMRVFPDFSNLQPGAIVNGVVTLLFSDGTPRNVTVLTVVAPSSSGSPGLGLEAGSCSSAKLEIQFRSPAAQQVFAAALGKPTTIEVQVVDDCGNLIGVANPANASVNATFSNQDADVKLTHIGNGIWTGTWKPANATPGQAIIAVTAFNSNGSVVQSGQRSVSGTLSGGATPTLVSGGVVHAASDASGVPIAPGGLITIYGSNLADAQGLASTLPLPQQQNGAEVLLGNTLLPILYTSDGQLNVQVPFNTPVNGQYQLSVQRDNLLSVPEQLVIAAAQPGVFTVNQQGTGQGVIFKSDGITLAQTGTPANAGETVVIYCTGLGAVTPAVPEGAPPPSSPLSNTLNPVTVTIGGQDAPVSFSGLTPGFPGLYQVNAVVPAGVPGAAVPVVISVAGQTSPPVTMAIAP